MSRDFEKLVKGVYKNWKIRFIRPRGKHLEEEDFFALISGALSSKEAARFKNHILSCEKCAESLAVSVKLQKIPEIEPPDKLLESAWDLINKEISGQRLDIFLSVKDKLLELLNTTGDVLAGREIIPAAVFRGRKTKGFQDAVVIYKDFKNIRVEVRIEAQEKGSFSLQVVIKEKKAQEPVKDLRISLIKDNLELESYLGLTGKAVFDHVVFGRYTVEISNLTEKVAEILIDIKV